MRSDEKINKPRAAADITVRAEPQDSPCGGDGRGLSSSPFTAETLTSRPHGNWKGETGAAFLCSICISTFRRPDLLERLLRSLESQEIPEGTELEIIIVDNDSEKTAEQIVKGFRDKGRIRFHYFHQPRKNISLARNLAVRKASGRYILFIDDDESAPPQWLVHLVEALESFEADGVFGPLVPEFNTQAPEWIRKPRLFYHPVPATGAPATSKWIGNCILRAELLKPLEEPFDPRYGITGGEDTHLLDRLEQQGARFIYCQEAWVSEYLPPRKTRLSYLFFRALKGGNAHTRRVIEGTPQQRGVIRLFMIVKSLALGSVSLALMIAFCPNRARSARWLMRLGSNVGRFLAAFGWHYQGYR